MIYLDYFLDNKVIPFYIGQTSNFQQRHKQHFKEILSLNKLSYDTYKKLFFYKENKRGAFYDGSYKSCKIFKYMVEHNLDLSQWHMIILEECPSDILNEREQYYFNEYKPAFFGFNQLNTHIELVKACKESRVTKLTDSKISELLHYINQDTVDIACFYEFGFTKFNYLYAFIKEGINYSSINDEVEQKIKKTNENIRNLNNKLDYQGKYTTKEFENLKIIHNQLYEKKKSIETNIKNEIEHFLNINKIKSKNIFTWLQDVIFYKNEKSKALLNKYITSRKYKNKIDNLIKNLISEYNDIDKKYSKQKYEYNEELIKVTKIRKENQDEVLKLIFPNKQYLNFPLKDNFKTFKFNKPNNKDNYCLINLCISNNGKNKIPDLIKIDYFICGNDIQVESYNNFIQCETTQLIQENKIEYHEKDFISPNLFSRECFNIIPIHHKSKMKIKPQISILSEYETGINDFTLQSKSLVSFDVVLETIYKHTNDNTKYQIYLNEYSPTLEWALSRLESKHYNDDFIQKLINKKLLDMHYKEYQTIIFKNKAQKAHQFSNDKLKIWNERISEKSHNQISVIDYINSKLPLTAKCNTCKYEWKIRCDHLLERLYCPKCKNCKI